MAISKLPLSGRCFLYILLPGTQPFPSEALMSPRICILWLSMWGRRYMSTSEVLIQEWHLQPRFLSVGNKTGPPHAKGTCRCSPILWTATSWRQSHRRQGEPQVCNGMWAGADTGACTVLPSWASLAWGLAKFATGGKGHPFASKAEPVQVCILSLISQISL